MRNNVNFTLCNFCSYFRKFGSECCEFLIMSSHSDEVDDVAPIAGPSGVARPLLVEEESAEGTSVAASSF